MAKIFFDTQLQVSFLKEGRRYIAYAPALDLSTSGKTLEEARKRFGEAAMLFFDELTRRGTLGEVLGELGWQKINRSWKPPMVVSQQSETIKIPVAA